MLALRYVACPDCETVFAVPEAIRVCDRCGATDLEPLATDPAAAAYFSDALDADAES